MAIEPPILQAIQRLRSDIERAVPGFPRKYRYSLGAQLREEIHAVARLANRAWRYLRYVDDFVLVHHDRAQLEDWRQQIVAFLAKTLRLSLKAEQHLRPLGDGIDFLGYIVRPTHSVPRRRVIAHARSKLATWGSRHAHGGFLRVTPAALRKVDAVWASYQGHFQHCRAHRLGQDFHRRFPWLQTATGVRRRFHHSAEGKALRIPLS